MHAHLLVHACLSICLYMPVSMQYLKAGEMYDEQFNECELLIVLVDYSKT